MHGELGKFLPLENGESFADKAFAHSGKIIYIKTSHVSNRYNREIANVKTTKSSLQHGEGMMCKISLARPELNLHHLHPYLQFGRILFFRTDFTAFCKTSQTTVDLFAVTPQFKLTTNSRINWRRPCNGWQRETWKITVLKIRIWLDPELFFSPELFVSDPDPGKNGKAAK